MRLIDADALKDKLLDKSYTTYTHEFGEAIPIEWLLSAIDNAPTISANHEDNHSCRTCFYNDKGFCRLKYFTIYDDSYGCDLYSKMKDDNI